ncbi:27488_t:CDS:2, partial [Dentiscutata erythropus]
PLYFIIMNLDLFATRYKRPRDDQRIKIVIFLKDVMSTVHIVNDLDRDATLGDARKYLAKIENDLNTFIGWKNTFFRNASRKIPHSDEDNYNVEGILILEEDFYSLHIEIDETIPCVPELVRNLNMDRGYNKHDENSIIPANTSAFSIKDLHMKDIIIENKLEITVKQSNRKIEQFWIESFENNCTKQSDKIAENCSDEIVLNKYTTKTCHKGTILLSCKDLEATEEYINAINNALDGNHNDTQKKDNLKNIGNDYGFFGWHEIKLGGKFLEMTNEHKIIGGIGDRYDGNTPEWIESLESYKTWEIIEYKDKFSLYELLPEEMQLEIKRLNGMKFPITLPVPMPPEIPTLKDNKIFASILNKDIKKPFKDVFGIRIDYQTDNIIGYDKDLPTQPISNNSGLEGVWTKDSENMKIEGPIIQKHCLIGTCVLHLDKNPNYDFAQSKSIISYYSCQSPDKELINIFCNQNSLYDSYDEESQLKFEVNCAIFNGNDIGRLPPKIVRGPTKQSWKEPRDLMKNERNLFIGNKWDLSDSNLIFASLVYLDSLGDHFFLNNSPEYPIIQSPIDSDNEIPNCSQKCIEYDVKKANKTFTQETSQSEKENIEITQLTEAFGNLKLYCIMDCSSNELEEVKKIIYKLTKIVNDITKTKDKDGLSKGREIEHPIKKTDIRFFEFVKNQKHQVIKKVVKEKDSIIKNCLRIEIKLVQELFNSSNSNKNNDELSNEKDVYLVRKVDKDKIEKLDVSNMLKGAINKDKVGIKETYL